MPTIKDYTEVYRYINVSVSCHTFCICVPFFAIFEVHVYLGTHLWCNIIQDPIYLVLIQTRGLKKNN